MQGIASNPNVAKAAEVVDGFFIRSALYLGVNPLARLLFIIYLIGIHLWAFLVLSFHTHQMEQSAASVTSTESNAIISPTGQRLG
jgi:hypothetical protein